MSDQEYIEKVMKGLTLAYEKLVRRQRLRNGNLVLSYNGNVELVPARKVRISTDK
jgi:hypothetical protein